MTEKMKKKNRCGQDSNLRRETLMDFKSIALTTRPPQLPVVGSGNSLTYSCLSLQGCGCVGGERGGEEAERGRPSIRPG